MLLHGSIFDKTAFCLGQKQGMLENGECSSWYNRAADFLVSVWVRRKHLHTITPLHSAWSIALRVMTVECE